MIEEIHCQKRDFIHDVDPAKVRVELDGVERRGHAFEQRDVSEVQVAVALAHPAVALARVEHRDEGGVLAPGPVAQPREQRDIRLRACERQHLLEVLQRGREYALRASKRIAGAGARDLPMERSQAARERVNVRRRERAAARHAVEQIVLIETPHPERVFDRRSAAADHRRRGAAADGEHIQIQSGRGAAVQAQFFFAIVPARGERAEIQKTEIHRFLDLVGIVAGEQDAGDVGLQHFDAPDCMRIARRFAQRGDQPVQALGAGVGCVRRIVFAGWVQGYSRSGPSAGQVTPMRRTPVEQYQDAVSELAEAAPESGEREGGPAQFTWNPKPAPAAH